MFSFMKKYEELEKKPIIELDPCHFCGNDKVKFESSSLDYFKYRLKIECDKCGFKTQIYGKPDEAFTPEEFKKSWDKFISTWNKSKKEI
jgi:ribosomal protein S27E